MDNSLTIAGGLELKASFSQVFDVACTAAVFRWEKEGDWPAKTPSHVGLT